MEDKLYESLFRYYRTLSNFGSIKDSHTINLIIYDFIIELLEGECKEFITLKEKEKLYDILSCIQGSDCILPYPDGNMVISIGCPNKIY
jgi:predicted house-cleaning noncanonical NTP pyrophosphatase (MazG superfamily)